MADYHALGQFHYLAGPPRGIKRVWAVRTPRELCGPAGPEIAAVLVVAPPVACCRPRNLATAGRYAGCDRADAHRRLNHEVETIARVVVHPIFRGCGLAVRLVGHAVAHAGTPLVEALAAMGSVHPFFELAGMTAYRLPLSRPAARLLSAADAVGLSPEDVAAIEPVRRFLGRHGHGGWHPQARLVGELRATVPNTSGLDPRTSERHLSVPPLAGDHSGKLPVRAQTLAGKQAAFLRAELDRFIADAFTDARRRRLAATGADALLAEACRAATAAPIYYLANRSRNATRQGEELDR